MIESYGITPSVELLRSVRAEDMYIWVIDEHKIYVEQVLLMFGGKLVTFDNEQYKWVFSIPKNRYDEARLTFASAGVEVWA